MPLDVQVARGILTKKYTQVFNENIPAPSFLRSFFPSVVYPTDLISIEVRRGTEKIAVDVLRGTRGNRNIVSLSTEKNYRPPFYKEFFDATEIDNYDRVFGQSAEADVALFSQMGQDIANEYLELRKKIERAKEKQCAEVFETGVVTMVNGDAIDFKRKADSLVDLGPDYWDTASAKQVEESLTEAAKFIRTDGKNGAGMFNLKLSEEAWLVLKGTDFFKNDANYQNVQLNDIRRPETEPFGATYHGTITAGSSIFNVWTYDETYEEDDGTTKRYLDKHKAVITPVTGTRFQFSHAALPQIMRDTRNAEFPELIGRVAAEYARTNHIDKNAMAHYFWLMSAGVALPITVDQIYTMKVIDDSEAVVG